MEKLAGKGSPLLSAAAVVVIVYGMQAAKVLLVPFLLALFLALISVRPLLWLQQRRVPSVLAALLIVTAIMLVIGVAGTIVGTSIAEFTAALPTYQTRLATIVAETGAWFYDFIGKGRENLPNLADLVDPGFAMRFAATILNAVRDVLTNAFLILFTMVFILLEASSIATKARAAFGQGAGAFRQARQFLDNLGRYLGIKTVVSLATGFLAWLVTWLVGLDFPLLWGMLAFLFNYVPTIGSIIAAVPPVLLGLIQLGPAESMTTAIGFLVINVVFGNLLEPRLMGHGVGISPLIVFTGLVFWGWVFGPVGMLLSVPLTMTLKMALESRDDTRWMGILIGSERDAQYELAQDAERND
ncbi:MAG: AI-2E family transporter [Gammaproteobacteria bacterium]|nr:AI-2E family transporter [Gammaproteobacteria bacterium]